MFLDITLNHLFGKVPSLGKNYSVAGDEDLLLSHNQLKIQKRVVANPPIFEPCLI